MRLKDILNESPTDLVANYYKTASKSLDACFNPEAVNFADKNKEYYTDNFKDFKKHGITPVFDKPAKNTQPMYDHNPQKNDRQSAGYRGKQLALKAAGLPYDNYTQDYDPTQAPSGIDSSLNS